MYPRKKSVALISALLVSLTLAACGGGGGGDSSGNGGDGSTPPVVTTPVDTNSAKVRFFNAASCYGDQSASIGSAALFAAQGYNKPASAAQNIPLTAGTTIVNTATGTLVVSNVNMVAQNNYTLVTANNSAAQAKLLVAQSALFDPAGTSFRMRVINAGISAVDVYVIPSGGQGLPVTPTFSLSSELSVSEPLIQAVTANELRLVIKVQGDRVLFDSATNDLKVAIGDDLTIVVPQFSLCAGAETNRVRALNAKAGAVDQTIINSDALIGTLTAVNSITSSNGIISPLYIYRDSLDAGNYVAFLRNRSRVVDTRVHTLHMYCGSESNSVIFTPPQRGRKYDVSATCIDRNSPSSITATDLGEYGN
jgi:hypothetical protein